MSTSANTIKNLSAQLEEMRRSLATAKHANKDLRAKLTEASCTSRKMIAQNAELKEELRQKNIFLKKVRKSLQGIPS